MERARKSRPLKLQVAGKSFQNKSSGIPGRKREEQVVTKEVLRMRTSLKGSLQLSSELSSVILSFYTAPLLTRTSSAMCTWEPRKLLFSQWWQKSGAESEGFSSGHL